MWILKVSHYNYLYPWVCIINGVILNFSSVLYLIYDQTWKEIILNYEKLTPKESIIIKIMMYSLKLRKVTFINENKTRNEMQRINSTTQSTSQVNVPKYITLYRHSLMIDLVWFNIPCLFWFLILIVFTGSLFISL